MFQKALNRVLTLPKARARRELSIGVIYGIRQQSFDLRRVTAILLQQKNFGPNVIYFALGMNNLKFAGGISGASLGESPGAGTIAAPLYVE